MRPRYAALFLLTSVAPGGPSTPRQGPITFRFDGDTVDQPPRGFEFGRTGGGALGRWVVRAETDAPSAPHVLAQVDSDKTDYRFPVAFTGPALADLRLSVKCKPVSGRVDQGCGVVFRLKDADNYYVARANALEDDVRSLPGLVRREEGHRRARQDVDGCGEVRPLDQGGLDHLLRRPGRDAVMRERGWGKTA